MRGDVASEVQILLPDCVHDSFRAGYSVLYSIAHEPRLRPRIRFMPHAAFEVQVTPDSESVAPLVTPVC